MKKAKVMLTAIAVIAFVSGSLAFKAYHKNINLFYAYCPTTPGATQCVEGTVTGTTITTANLAQFQTATFKGTLDLNAVDQDCAASCTATIEYKTSSQN